MAFAKKTKEEWNKEAKERSKATTLEHLAESRQLCQEAGVNDIGGLILLLISEFKVMNNNLYWIQKSLKAAQKAPGGDNMPNW